MRKCFAVLAGVFALAVISSCAWADVAINSVNFPDEVFREYVKQFDYDSDGTLSDNELSSVTFIGLDGNVINQRSRVFRQP